MINLTGVTHHPAIEEIVEVLCNKTQNTDRGFFRTEVAYFLAKMASNMRALIVTKDRGEIPVNIYALALATSGFGKGHSVNLVENEFMKGFKKRFIEDTMPMIAEKTLWEIANSRAARQGTDQQEEFDKADNEYKRAGAYPFTFDSGTVPAVKQLRNKLLMANCGAVNLQIDEVGSNLMSNVDVLTLFLELYDQGIVKQKLTKNTAENTRGRMSMARHLPTCFSSVRPISCWMVARLRNSSTRSLKRLCSTLHLRCRSSGPEGIQFPDADRDLSEADPSGQHSHHHQVGSSVP